MVLQHRRSRNQAEPVLSGNQVGATLLGLVVKAGYYNIQETVMLPHIYLYVDDLRTPCGIDDDNCLLVIARSYDETISVFEKYVDRGIEFLVDLDHDLGEEKSGYDICKYIVENQIPLRSYRLHTMNPVGRHNMDQLLSHYGYKKE